MLQSTMQHEVVFYERTPPRRFRFRGPIAAMVTIAAVVASGAIMTRLDGATSRAALSDHQAQPFDHFPR